MGDSGLGRRYGADGILKYTEPPDRRRRLASVETCVARVADRAPRRDPHKRRRGVERTVSARSVISPF
jgi:hypothetical protein